MSDSTYMDEDVGEARQDRTCCSICEGSGMIHVCILRRHRKQGRVRINMRNEK